MHVHVYESRVFICPVAKCVIEGYKPELLHAHVDCRDTFDCGVLSDRSFLLNPEHLDVLGYGRDQTGSLIYLAETLKDIEEANGGR